MEIRISEGQETSPLTVGAVISAEPSPADVEVQNHGSLFTFTLCTPLAFDWVEENVECEVHMWLSSRIFACEHRWARDLAAGMQDAGLKVEPDLIGNQWYHEDLP